MKVIYFLFALVSLLVPSANGVEDRGDADVVQVRGKGMGETRELALKDAFRDAVERAVETFIAPEQFVDHDDLVKDTILTYSNAYIVRYEEKKTSRYDGLIEVLILAWVRRGYLTRKLANVMPTVTSDVADDSRNLYAQIVTRDKCDADAETLLKSFFDSFDPLVQMMKISVVNEKSPEVSRAKGSSEAKVFSYQLKLQIDADKYFNACMPTVDGILSQISLCPGRPFNFSRISRLNGIWSQVESRRYSEKRKTEYFSYDNMYFMYANLLDGARIIFGDGCSFGRYDDYGVMESAIAERFSNDSVWSAQWYRRHRSIRRWGVPEMKAKVKLYVALVKHANSNGCSGSLYELGDGCAEFLSSWMAGYSGLSETRCFDDISGRSTTYHVAFKDHLGREIAYGDCRAFNHDMSNVGCVCWGDDRKGWLGNRDEPQNTIPYVIYITPWIGCFAGECTTWVDVEMKTEDLPKIVTRSVSVGKR